MGFGPNFPNCLCLSAPSAMRPATGTCARLLQMEYRKHGLWMHPDPLAGETLGGEFRDKGRASVRRPPFLGILCSLNIM